MTESVLLVSYDPEDCGFTCSVGTFVIATMHRTVLRHHLQ